MFEPYTGPWGVAEAAHLLRRCVFGPTKSRIQQAVKEGLEGSLDTLMGRAEPVDPPVYYDYEADPLAGIGETWVDKPITQGVDGIYFNRSKTMWAWWFMRMSREQQTMTEKMRLFWHNHFVISEAGNPNMNWTYLQLLEAFSLGDFRELTKRITIDQSMLIYLNGTQNVKDEPNENYARELLELFTIGKGPLVAEGDYTHYTEQDIVAMARALTGWVAWNGQKLEARFQAGRHDTGTKQLSHRFGNQVIENEGPEEYKRVVDIIFEQPEVARHICRRLYRWFVHYEIDERVEAGVIEPMAQVLRDHDYVIGPALRALLRSQHFFEASLRGAMIKNSFDFFFSVYNSVQVKAPPSLFEEYEMWERWYWQLQRLGMAFFKIPSVAGWRAYHQGPMYYRDWINSASLDLRKRLLGSIDPLIDNVSKGHKGMDFLSFIEELEDPLDVNHMLDELCQLLFPRPMTQAQKDFFKENLIPGLPDFEWTVEYEAYLLDPDNKSKQMSVENKLRQMFFAMFSVPEFQLS